MTEIPVLSEELTVVGCHSDVGILGYNIEESLEDGVKISHGLHLARPEPVQLLLVEESRALLVGYQLSALLSGVALTEAVLAYPGMGRLILEAVFAQDLFLVMASLIMSSFLLLVGNLIADILLSLSDPRISLQ